MDRWDPKVLALAASIDAIGGRLNVLGLGLQSSTQTSPARREVRERIVEALGPRAPAAGTAAREELMLLEKFFSLSAHLDDFSDSDVLVFMDAFDTKVETKLTLSELRRSFERLRGAGERLVLFSGEQNCWPFPHAWGNGSRGETFHAGDYRADYEYVFDNGLRLRGDEVCDHWRQQHADSRLLPYPNSGLFMGSVSDLRMMFSLAWESLQRFGDLDDQALLFATALQAQASANGSDRKLVTVDADARLLASLHGVDLETFAARFAMPKVCSFVDRFFGIDFPARLLHGDGLSASGEGLESPSAVENERPALLHFNGMYRSYYYHYCIPDQMVLMSSLGPQAPISFLLYEERVGAQMDVERERSWMVPLPWPLPRPTPAELLLPLRSLRPAQLRDALLNLAVTRSAAPVGQRRAARTLRLPALEGLAELGHQEKQDRSRLYLDAVVLDRSSAECSRRSSWHDYCRVYHVLSTAWRRLRPAGNRSCGFLWIEFASANLRGIRALADARRPETCTRLTAADASFGAQEPCPMWAVVDFLQALEPWESVQYEAIHPQSGESAILALRSSVRTPFLVDNTGIIR
eukprot:TRINITY_DN27278_c0_g1_i1.p1 TRINITY_DN27278_c0_g1~~TRINITY_DN27278_c0_g1_i1.p1  ORF type:complete len:679 (-),score=134.08 TRINITY_DN27278_c0_g1_i1:46-1785(-)